MPVCFAKQPRLRPGRVIRCSRRNSANEALTEFDAIGDHRKEIFWVWKITEAIEGLGDVDHKEACALYNRSLDTWNRWKSEGGPDSVFFRAHHDRAAQLAANCR